MIQKLTNYASIIGVIGAIGGGFYAWGEFNTRLDSIENKDFVVNEQVDLTPINEKISELEVEVLKLARKIVSKSNLTIKIGKKAFYKQLEMPISKAYKYTSEIMTKNAMELDAEEGISAFLEKRKPNWKNK